MTADEIKRVQEHLRTQFEQARPILFTGAGFSRDCKDFHKRNLPSAEELTRLLWDICYPGEAYEPGSDLQIVFQRAMAKDSRSTIQLIKERFSVAPESTTKWQFDILSFPWSKIYTLNLDDLSTAIQRNHNLPRKITSFSALSEKALNQALLKPYNDLAQIHLNGTLDDLPNGVTFSLTQYAQRLSSTNDPWYAELARDLILSSVVFIGTELDEPSLWMHIEERKSKGSTDNREMRPKSYLVIPTLSKPRRDVLKQYNIVWLPMTGEEFTNTILSPIVSCQNIGLAYLSARSSGIKPTLDQYQLPIILKTAFGATSDLFSGAEPTWGNIINNIAITRDYDRNLADTCQRLLDTNAKTVAVISGTAGSGKSASAKRLALHLHNSGKKILWFDKYKDASPRDILEASREYEPHAIVIDDADLYGSEISAITRDLSLLPCHPLVILVMRGTKIDRCITPFITSSLSVCEFTVPHLTDGDIVDLLEALKRENRLGLLTSLSPDERIKRMKQKCGRQLLVAMIEATSEMTFEQKIADESRELDGPARALYAYACVSSAIRQPLSRTSIMLAHGSADNDAVNALALLIKRGLLIETDNMMIFARHRVIAEKAMDALKKTGVLSDVLVGLCFAHAAGSSLAMPTGQAPRRHLIYLLNHDFLKNHLGVENARSHYEKMTEFLSWEFSFWLHRGSLELEDNKIEAAERCLANARGINATDHNTQTEYAYLLFKKALRDPKGANAITMIEEADKILTANIALRGMRDPHSYHVLGNNLIHWGRSGPLTFDDKIKLAKRILSLADEAIKKHPKDKYIMQLQSDAKSFYMGLAVK